MYRGLAAFATVLLWQGAARAELAPPADAPGEPSSARSAYAADVRRAMAGTWRPDDVFRAGHHGSSLGPWTVRLRVAVSAEGAVRDVAVEASSGLRPFDEEAVRATRALQPFPPPPGELVDPGSATAVFPLTLVHAGWQPPRFAGDPLVRTPQTRTWEIGTSVDLERRATARQGSREIAARASFDRTTLTLTAARDLGAFGMLELQLPIATLRYREPATGVRRDVSGMADASLHYHRTRQRSWWSTHLFFGLRLPTGATAATPVTGEALPTVVQLGSGTLDPEFGACTHLKLGGTTALVACDHGRIALYANSHGYREGYEFHARLLVTQALAGGRISSQLGVLHETRSAAHAHGEALASTARRTFFAEASVWLLLYRGLALRSTLELPVHASVRGTQLADTLRVMAGLSYDFDRR
jgi:TonB family protein